ncbi:MAG: alpha/beta fold hydrolase [Candidatus Rokubacteria bacterium]|nr:alpha/beta fold hydrolase [Candidatus Rokubacteria bacterium]
MRAWAYAAVVGACAVGGFVVLSLLAFWVAVRPPRIAIPLGPEDYRLDPETVSIEADDGVRLAGWLLPRAGAPAVIFLHGYPADKRDMLPLAAALAPRFTVLLMDLRHFGQSGGAVTTLGLRERRDLARVLDVLAARGFARVGVFGFSLGGAVALMTAADDDRIGAVVAYASFADLETLGRELYFWLGPLRYPLVRLMMLWGRLFLGGDLTRPSPLDAARRLGTPVFLIHSRGDEQIPFAHAERLRAALGTNARAEFYFPGRGRHGELPADFLPRVAAFFDAHLRRPPPR